MSWGANRGRYSRERSDALSSVLAPYEGPAGLPAPRDGQIPGHWKSAPSGSHGGCPIWILREAWMPQGNTSAERLARLRSRPEARETLHRGEIAELWEHDAPQDPDGFRVFGRYPKGFLKHVLKMRLMGSVGRDDILHVCSGTLSETERWTVDIRPEARPLVVASGTALPFADASFAAVMMDPPYSDAYARNLYRTEMPRNSWLLREAARVVKPCGRIGILHVAVPFSPPGCRLVNVYGISTGVGFRIRAFTVYERKQAHLAGLR